MASSNKKFWDQILDTVEKQDGFEVDRTSKNNHIRITREGYKPIVWVPSTPSEYRGMKNAISLLRRELDFVWQGR